MKLFLCLVLVFIAKTGFVEADCNVVSKDDWGGISSTHVEWLRRPVNLVIVQHTDTPPCDSDDACEARVQSIQDYHMDELKYWDIGSAFLIGGNGKVYEGSGWLHVGVPNYNYNKKALRITLIGSFNSKEPKPQQIDALRALLKCGVENGHLSQNYKVVGHRQLMDTDSPGRKLYNIIRRWPEWTINVDGYKN